MHCSRTLHRTVLWFCAALIVSVSLGAARAVAQSSPVAQPVPGLGGLANASIRQITRDGTRVLVAVGSPGFDGYVLVLETGTGAVLFDSRPVQTSDRTYATATLSPDGTIPGGRCDGRG